MNEEIEKILNQLVVDGQKVSFAHMEYKGKKTTYITYHLISKDPSYADDYPFFIVCTYDFDIYSKKNYLKIEDELRKLLLDNDWTWVEDMEDEYDNDTLYFHKTMTFRKEINYG